MTTPNVPLMREVAGWIREQVIFGETAFQRHARAMESPEQAPELVWDQGDWAEEIFGAECKTSCCVAGYVTLTDPEVDAKKTRENDLVVRVGDRSPSSTYFRHAQERLGLDDDQAGLLFYNLSNNPDVILVVMSDIAGEEL